MTYPIWDSGQKEKKKKEDREKRKRNKANFRVYYSLAYEGGGTDWVGYYRTYFGARVAAFWNLHISSYGGTAKIYPF